MNNKLVGLVVLIISIFGIGMFIWSQDKSDTPEYSSTTKARLGWQTPWATQGQLVQTMVNTDIPKENGLELELTGFASGAPLNEAAASGKVDVLLTADQPAITLISKQPEKWQVIGRLMYNRVSVYVPPQSPINSIAELRGKNVGVPYGTAAQKALILAEQKAGLTPGTDVTNANIDILTQSGLVNDSKVVKWGNFDALAGFDPTPAIFISKGYARYINTDEIVSVVVMSKDYIAQNPDAPKQFMNVLGQSYEYYRTNQDQANEWFRAASKLQVEDAVLNDAASVEPNMKLSNPIRLIFTDADLATMQQTADFLLKNKLIDTTVTVKDYVQIPEPIQ